MGMIDGFDFLFLAASGGLSASLALVMIPWLTGRKTRYSDQARAEDNRLIFLFDGDTLVDTSAQAQRWLDENAVPAEEEHARVTAYIDKLFPEASYDAQGELPVPPLDMASSDGSSHLRLRQIGSTTRVELTIGTQTQTNGLDSHSVMALQGELETLRETAEHLPYLIWRETPSGEVTWINRAYFDFVETHQGAALARQWPPVNLFETRGFLGDTAVDAAGRLPVRGLKGDPSWFDCRACRVHNEVLFCAADAASAVRAEMQLREFTQTLAKTFSHLTVGLAIFDRGRRLRLFNPALSDLTSLSPEFLTARPTLFGFLDELREAQMIPEPKDYQNWRAQLAEMEAAAISGTYQETWTLPSGQTYRVAGRPHPDGSLAFLFEDISSEISLTRRFRAELELSQAVVDTIPDAVAVFSRSGTLTLTNAAFVDLWNADPAATLDAPNVNDLTALWYEQSHPTPAWGDFREFCLSPGGRAEWSADIGLQDGRALTCRFAPLPGGSTIAVFSPQQGAANVRISQTRLETA